MIIECPKCRETLALRPGGLPPEGVRVPCPSCGRSFLLLPRAAWKTAPVPAPLLPLPPPPPPRRPVRRSSARRGAGRRTLVAACTVLALVGLAVAAGVLRGRSAAEEAAGLGAPGEPIGSIELLAR